jgi:hypothetical protein
MSTNQNTQNNNTQNTSAQNQQVNTQVNPPVQNQPQQNVVNMPENFAKTKEMMEGKSLTLFGRIFGRHSMNVLFYSFLVVLVFTFFVFVIPSMKPAIEFYFGEDKQEQTIKEQKKQAEKTQEQVRKLEDEVIKANQTISDLQKENQKVENEKDAVQDTLLKLTQQSQSKR